MKMEPVHFSETLLTNYQTTWAHIPDYFSPNLHHCETPKFNTELFKFHCFTVHFDSLSFIHINSYTFSYNYVSVF